MFRLSLVVSIVATLAAAPAHASTPIEYSQLAGLFLIGGGFTEAPDLDTALLDSDGSTASSHTLTSIEAAIAALEATGATTDDSPALRKTHKALLLATSGNLETAYVRAERAMNLAPVEAQDALATATTLLLADRIAALDASALSGEAMGQAAADLDAHVAALDDLGVEADGDAQAALFVSSAELSLDSALHWVPDSAVTDELALVEEEVEFGLGSIASVDLSTWDRMGAQIQASSKVLHVVSDYVVSGALDDIQ